MKVGPSFFPGDFARAATASAEGLLGGARGGLGTRGLKMLGIGFYTPPV